MTVPITKIHIVVKNPVKNPKENMTPGGIIDASITILIYCPSITNEVFLPSFRSAINSAMIYDDVIDPSSVA